MTRTQRYVSNELTHFVGKALKIDEDRYQLLLMIIRTGFLSHPPHVPSISGNVHVVQEGNFSDNEMYGPEVVCFCDIPCDDLELHPVKYGRFGISFSKEFLVSRGANPVFYVPTNAQVPAVSYGGTTDLGQVFNEGVRQWHELINISNAGIVAAFQNATTSAENVQTMDLHKFGQMLRELTMFMSFRIFSHVKCFDASKDETDPENFYMEREWRIVGNLFFSFSDIARILIPAEYGMRLRNDLPDYAAQVQFLS
jgi:hypothetical protein